MKKTITILTLLMSFMAFSGCSFLDDILGILDDGNQNNTGDTGDTGGIDIINTNVEGKIDTIFFAQTHVQQPDHEYFTLVGNRETLIKANIISSRNVRSSQVIAALTLDGKTFDMKLTGPDVLPSSIPVGPGVVHHSFDDSFTGYIPAKWMKAGLTVKVETETDSVEIKDLKIGAPTKVIMTMFDVQFFNDTNGDYPAGWEDELESKWPVAELEVRRVRHVVFKKLVIPARAGVSEVLVMSKDDYKQQTGINFDGEQAAALQWKSALKAAAGINGRYSLYYVNIYGVAAGGQAGGFGGVGNGTSAGILNHELGHALSLPHYGNNAAYPYKGDMFGIPAPEVYMNTHVGPAWGFDLVGRAFIPPTVQLNSVGGTPGTYKKNPMQGGGQGDQEKGYLMRHFSDYCANKMRNYLEGHVVVWNSELNSYAVWNRDTNSYSSKVSNNGVSYPIERDIQVLSVMASVDGAKEKVNHVYPPIGPYTAGIIKLFDPSKSADRVMAEQVFCPSKGCDVSLRITQGGAKRVYMLRASWEQSLKTTAVNLPASNGEVTKVDLLLTPDAEHNGLPANPRVLSSWSK